MVRKKGVSLPNDDIVQAILFHLRCNREARLIHGLHRIDCNRNTYLLWCMYLFGRSRWSFVGHDRDPSAWSMSSLCHALSRPSRRTSWFNLRSIPVIILVVCLSDQCGQITITRVSSFFFLDLVFFFRFDRSCVRINRVNAKRYQERSHRSWVLLLGWQV